MMKGRKRFCKDFLFGLYQFFLLLKKNAFLQIRRPTATVVELMFPPLLVLFMVIFRLADSRFMVFSRCIVTYDADSLNIPSRYPFTLYYAPNTSQAAVLLAETYIAPRLVDSNGTVVGMATQDDFINDIYDMVFDDDTGIECGCFGGRAAVYFDDIEGNDIHYTLRLQHEADWKTDSIYNPIQIIGPLGESNPYFNHGFLHLQKIISESIIEMRTNETVSISVNTRAMPFPKYDYVVYLQTMLFILPSIVWFALLPPSAGFVRELVHEKESRIHQTMKIMGLTDTVLWTSWYTKQFMYLLVPTILVAVELNYGELLSVSGFLPILITLLIFMISSISFCFMISAWFNSAQIGLLSAVVFWLLAAVPFITTFLFFFDVPFGVKLATCLFPTSACGYAVYIMMLLELERTGLQWSNFATSLPEIDGLHMGYIVMMLLIDTVLYMLVYLYVAAVKPGKYGVPKPFYFFLLPSFWCGKKEKQSVSAAEVTTEEIVFDDPSAHETYTGCETAGVHIHNLTKVFNPKSKQNKVAVDNLNLKFYKGQITALLGHNGAGKTTTVSIMTGLFPSTSGNVYINGQSINDDFDSIRGTIGICPQHNVLFDRLTVREHLNFFAKLKGVTHKITDEIDELIDDLHLTDKEDTQSQYLSGGTKRKLSVAIALVGGSKVVFLDEPSSGMDPYSRRITWDVLQKYREDKTIILTTHFMDEADILGDRIAIMAEGKLHCSGSSLFLKNRYGAGYHLTIEKSASADVAAISALVTESVDDAKFASDIGSQLLYILPAHSAVQFSALFTVIDNQMEVLGIASYGVSVTTMEEVFIKVGENKDETIKAKIERFRTMYSIPTILDLSNVHDANEKPNQVTFADRPLEEQCTQPDHPKKSATPNPTHSQLQALNSGAALWIQQFRAVLIKYTLMKFRFYVIVILEICIPLLCMVIALLVGLIASIGGGQDPNLDITVNNVALGDQRIFFWSQSGSGYPLTFGPENISSIVGSTEFLDYTEDVNNIYSSVSNHSDINMCCQYGNQLLDKYCITRTAEELSSACSDVAGFGYSDCKRCISCCHPEYDTYPTCSNPFSSSQNNLVSRISFCPEPPYVSINDFTSGTPVGPLNSHNIYVAERLLNVAEDMGVSLFHRNYMGGFVLHPQEPSFKSCSCNNVNERCALLSPSLASSSLLSDTSIDGEIFAGVVVSVCNITDLSNSIADGLCEMVLSNSLFNNKYDGWVDGCAKYAGCNTLGSTGVSQCSNISDQLVGKVSEPIPPDTELGATVWYNARLYHTSPMILNEFYNLYLKSLNNSLSLSVSNNPLPQTEATQVSADTSEDFTAFVICLAGVFGLCFLYASFVIVPVQENGNNAKHLQKVAGIHSTTYWLAKFFHNMVELLIICAILTVIFAAFQVDGYATSNELGFLFITLVLSSFVCIPFTYVVSFMFKNYLFAFPLVFLVLYFGSFLALITYILVIPNSTTTADALSYIFLLIPSYGITLTLFDLHFNFIKEQVCTSSTEAEVVCINENVQYFSSPFEFSRPGLGHVLLYLAIEGTLYLLLTLIIERGFFRKEISYLLGRKNFNRYNDDLVISEDPDVTEEQANVQNLTESEMQQVHVVLRNLKKKYKGTRSLLLPCCSSHFNDSHLAVNSLSLVIKKGECFGLLGVNGAGKTTTFKMLTGDISISEGSITVEGFDVSTQLRSVQQRIGYCPQFDALLERLTARELLTYYARLRGLPEKTVKGVVEAEIKHLDLVQYADRQCGTYSGGNKRKLSTAAALVGDPPIILLDEPTTGMDPVTSRFLWNVILGIIKEDRIVILTSHNMEECEALCTRLAIMVNGQFKCLGSIQHLKTRFGQGYTVSLKVDPTKHVLERPRSRRTRRQSNTIRNLKRTLTKILSNRKIGIPSPITNDIEKVTTFFKEKFPGTVNLEKHQDSAAYQVPLSGEGINSIFKQLEANKEALKIVDYNVSQTTLDQVFVKFAKEQEESKK